MDQRDENKPKKKSAVGLIILMVVLLLCVGGVVFALIKLPKPVEEVPVEEVVDNTPNGPGLPAIAAEASIASTGDMLIHTPILDTIYNWETGGYDFTEIYSQIVEYYSKADIMVANLEVTFGGPESGAYSGYPTFNCPDSLSDALKAAGVDMLLTANNHAYDTGSYGFHRTQDLITEDGFVHIGTRQNGDERFIYVTNVNGIKIGMACYSYDTRGYPEDAISLNGIYLDDEDQGNVNTFTYTDLESFYSKVENDLKLMDMLGIEANIFYVHWGEEYEDWPNDVQATMAQRMSDLGVDVIVGGHPHVVQSFDVLTGANGNQTICLYSMGNELSNQRKELMDSDWYRGYTEDGVIFTVTFQKFNNSKVKLKSVNVTPTWVDVYYDEYGEKNYRVVALDPELAGNWPVSDQSAAQESYDRTIYRLGEVYQNFVQN